MSKPRLNPRFPLIERVSSLRNVFSKILSTTNTNYCPDEDFPSKKILPGKICPWKYLSQRRIVRGKKLSRGRFVPGKIIVIIYPGNNCPLKNCPGEESSWKNCLGEESSLKKYCPREVILFLKRGYFPKAAKTSREPEAQAQWMKSTHCTTKTTFVPRKKKIALKQLSWKNICYGKELSMKNCPTQGENTFVPQNKMSLEKIVRGKNCPGKIMGKN